jgi:hypothetical protein
MTEFFRGLAQLDIEQPISMSCSAPSTAKISASAFAPARALAARYAPACDTTEQPAGDTPHG